jgi:glycosyltransferase involved in cell wall biosynthesis
MEKYYLKNRDTPFFSVIVPSYNRRDEIQELLLSLENQDLPKKQFEVVLVDDGSMDGTEAWVKEFRDRSSLQVTYVWKEHGGPGASRNLGMENAKGDVFIFIDSDCTAPHDWLVGIKEALDKNPSIQAFGGRDDAKLEFSPLLKAINYTMTSFLSTGGMRGGKKRRLAKFYPRSFNMGIRRDLYDKMGGFGNLRHGQDIEFSNRILKSGANVAYIHDSVVFHKRRTSSIKFFKQVFNWGVARINLSRIDSAMLEPLHFAPAFGLWFTLIFTLFAFLFPPVFPFWLIFVILVGILLLGSGVHAALKWKSLSTGFIVPAVMGIQIVGYAWGFTSAFVWRVLLKKEEFAGFIKRYYG